MICRNRWFPRCMTYEFVSKKSGKVFWDKRGNAIFVGNINYTAISNSFSVSRFSYIRCNHQHPAVIIDIVFFLFLLAWFYSFFPSHFFLSTFALLHSVILPIVILLVFSRLLFYRLYFHAIILRAVHLRRRNATDIDNARSWDGDI